MDFPELECGALTEEGDAERGKDEDAQEDTGLFFGGDDLGSEPVDEEVVGDFKEFLDGTAGVDGDGESEEVNEGEGESKPVKRSDKEQGVLALVLDDPPDHEQEQGKDVGGELLCGEEHGAQVGRVENQKAKADKYRHGQIGMACRRLYRKLCGRLFPVTVFFAHQSPFFFSADPGAVSRQ